MQLAATYACVVENRSLAPALGQYAKARLAATAQKAYMVQNPYSPTYTDVH